MQKNWTDKKLAAIDSHVGKQMKKARKRKGHTQKAVADHINLSYQQIQKYESAADRITASRMYQIASFLELPPSFFFDGLPLMEEGPTLLLSNEQLEILRHYESIPKHARKDVLKVMKLMATGQPLLSSTASSRKALR